MLVNGSLAVGILASLRLRINFFFSGGNYKFPIFSQPNSEIRQNWNFMLDSNGDPIIETTTSIRFYWGNEIYTKPIPWENFKKAMSIINSK